MRGASDRFRIFASSGLTGGAPSATCAIIGLSWLALERRGPAEWRLGWRPTRGPACDQLISDRADNDNEDDGGGCDAGDKLLEGYQYCATDHGDRLS